MESRVFARVPSRSKAKKTLPMIPRAVARILCPSGQFYLVLSGVVSKMTLTAGDAPRQRRMEQRAAAWQYGMTERRGVRAWRFPRKGQSRVIRRSRKKGRAERSRWSGSRQTTQEPYGRRQQKAQAENRWIHPAFRPRRGKHTRPVSLISIVLQDILPLKASLYVPARFHTA